MQPSQAAVTALIRACANARTKQCGGGADIVGAWRAWEWAVAHGLAPSVGAAHELLRACARAKAVPAVLRAQHDKVVSHDQAGVWGAEASAAVSAASAMQVAAVGTAAGPDSVGALRVWQELLDVHLVPNASCAAAFRAAVGAPPAPVTHGEEARVHAIVHVMRDHTEQ